ncbi:MAG: serine/threonine protein kinase [Alphaproteobacteria bacterium]|nr:serine/threonine protein kinase [Alphaproteobacteria bacterium]
MTAIGSTLGKFRIESILGRGATSIVYRAQDMVDSRVVALKALREELLADGERGGTLQRFSREARIGLSLRHPHIVRLWEAGEAMGVPFIAMELVQGEAMDTLTRRHIPVAPDISCALIAAVLDALEHAHRASIIHRDVKPANIVMRRPGADPVLMDFGVARMGGSDVTQLGEMLGTPAYMSPEQLRGAVIDHRTDLHAVGVILYQLVTGRRPYAGAVAEVMHQICTIEPPPPSTILPSLASFDAIIARSLAKDPRARFASAAEFAATLRSLSLGRSEQPAAAQTAAAAAQPRPAIRPASLDDLDQALRSVVAEGVDEEARDIIDDLLGRIANADRERFGRIALEAGILPLAHDLAATALRPGRATRPKGHWLSGVELAVLLQRRIEHDAAKRAGTTALVDLAFHIAGIFLTYSSELSSRLAADDAPDIGALELDFIRLDTLIVGLDVLGARRELRLAEAASRVMVAQVLRRAARIIEAYVETGDPMARFDVVAMLVQVDDLISLAMRLTGHQESSEIDSVAELGDEAARRFLQSVVGLVGMIADELAKTLASADASAMDEFVGQLKQVRLIYQFAAKLDGDRFKDLLTALTGGVYELFVRLTRSLTAGPANPTTRLQGEALYDMASSLGWRDLANQLLVWIRRSVLT